MLLTTAGGFHGRTITADLGLVCGEAVVVREPVDSPPDSPSVSEQVAANCEAELADAREIAILYMTEEATARGADGVVGVRLDYRVEDSLVMVFANGAAVSLSAAGTAGEEPPATAPQNHSPARVRQVRRYLRLWGAAHGLPGPYLGGPFTKYRSDFGGDSPGVYLFADEEDRVLCIGWTVDRGLNDVVRGHFQLSAASGIDAQVQRYTRFIYAVSLPEGETGRIPAIAAYLTAKVRPVYEIVYNEPGQR